MSALVAAGLVAGYGRTTVLRGVDLVVPPGSVVALLGPNGAGKTTLLRALSGTLPVSAGRVLAGEVELTHLDPHERLGHGISLVPEGRGIFRSLTVRENLVLFGAGSGDRQVLDRAVEAFPRLGQRLGQVAGTMSGGEQQMLALSRALAGAPSVVLLDEVSMGLAPVVVDVIFEVIDGIARSGAALLLVEQYVERALRVADYAYLLDRGRVAFAGEPSELADDDVLARYFATP